MTWVTTPQAAISIDPESGAGTDQPAANTPDQVVFWLIFIK